MGARRERAMAAVRANEFWIYWKPMARGKEWPTARSVFGKKASGRMPSSRATRSGESRGVEYESSEGDCDGEKKKKRLSDSDI